MSLRSRLGKIARKIAERLAPTTTPEPILRAPEAPTAEEYRQRILDAIAEEERLTREREPKWVQEMRSGVIYDPDSDQPLDYGDIPGEIATVMHARGEGLYRDYESSGMRAFVDEALHKGYLTEENTPDERRDYRLYLSQALQLERQNRQRGIAPEVFPFALWREWYSNSHSQSQS